MIKLVDDQGLKNELKKLGIEPLSQEFTVNRFQEMLVGKTTEIKAYLLDQKRIAGIGNIYADEILFKAGVKPGRKIDSLKPSEKKAIHAAIKCIIRKAIKYRGTTFNDYVDVDGNRGNFIKLLKVYHRDGEHCLRCKSDIILKSRIAGRGTHFCNKCQK